MNNLASSFQWLGILFPCIDIYRDFPAIGPATEIDDTSIIIMENLFGEDNLLFGKRCLELGFECIDIDFLAVDDDGLAAFEGGK